MMGKKLRTDQAAKRAGVHPRTIRRWADRGWLKAKRLPSGHLRIDEDDLSKAVPDAERDRRR